MILNACSGVLIISLSNAPIAKLLLFSLKSTTLCQALATADAVGLTGSQDQHSTRSSDIAQRGNRDATVKSGFGDCNSRIKLWFLPIREKRSIMQPIN